MHKFLKSSLLNISFIYEKGLKVVKALNNEEPQLVIALAKSELQNIIVNRDYIYVKKVVDNNVLIYEMNGG